MYFLPEEEKKQLLRYYLPKAREAGVAEELRGWNWHQPPLEPVYGTRLALYEVAGGYCPTGRDIFLRRVRGVRGQPNLAMLQGAILHTAVEQVLVGAKRAIYRFGVDDHRSVCGAVQGLQVAVPPHLAGQLNEAELQDTLGKVEILAGFEKARVLARLQEVLSKHPYIGVDALVNLVVPVVLEQKLDGTFLGLSGNLSTDAFVFSEPMIFDLKFGEPRDFHRLATTGYALVMEALYEFPVNLGCIVYGEFRGDRLLIKRDIHIISDELRQWFIEARDEKARLVSEEIDPGTGNCPATCQYYRVCFG
ncbi:MAG: type I-A CRISPR-associated protein Cas4/Csa1 [Desulfotomaculales bacterium]